MNKCYSKAFILLGQPDMISPELRAPVLREEDERGVPSTQMARDLAARMVEVSKDIRILPLHGKPHPTRLGLGLMLEELGETIQAAEQGDLTEFADGLADLIYVTIWTALAHGIDLPAVWAEVQRSNMEKFPECGACSGSGEPEDGECIRGCSACSGLGRVVIRDASGKVQKPPGWAPPDIKGVLARQGTP